MKLSMMMIAASLIGACAIDPIDDESTDTQDVQGSSELANGKVEHHVRDYAGKTARPKRGNGISYHGGPVILGTTNAHFIYYGNWSSGDRAILDNLASSIGGSPYFNINTTYYNGSNTHISNSVH